LDAIGVNSQIHLENKVAARLRLGKTGVLQIQFTTRLLGDKSLQGAQCIHVGSHVIVSINDEAALGTVVKTPYINAM